MFDVGTGSESGLWLSRVQNQPNQGSVGAEMPEHMTGKEKNARQGVSTSRVEPQRITSGLAVVNNEGRWEAKS